MRTDLPLTGQCLDELDSDFDPTRHRHIEPLPLNLDLCASAVQSRWCLAPAFSGSGRATIKACGRNCIGLRLLRTRPRTLWLLVKRDDATRPPMKPLAPVGESHQSNSIRPRATEPDTSRRKPSFLRRSQWSEGRRPRGMRASKARAGRRAGQACHRRWNAYGKHLPS
jgi:hypothetical protein